MIGTKVYNESMLRQIEGLRLSQRLRQLREAYFSAVPRVCGESPRLAMESYKESEGEHIELRRAKALKRVLEGIPVTIHEGELTVGSLTRFLRGAYPSIMWDAEYLSEVAGDGKSTFGSPEIRGTVSDEDWKACVEAMAYFKGKTPAELVRKTRREVMGAWYDDVVEAKGTHPYEELPQELGVPMFDKVISKGLRGMREEAQRGIQRFVERQEQDPEKLYFWQAVVIACEGVTALAGRYAQLALEMAGREENPTRRRELQEIAAVCNWVPENPARTFHEAIQSLRLMCLGLLCEGGCLGNHVGRLDQYLYPFFKRDMEQGRLTPAMAGELIGDLLSFLARGEMVRTKFWREHSQVTMIQHVTLGGMTRDGEDASNELTYLILHMMGLMGYAQPQASLRWHKGAPRRILMKGLETNRKVGGIPMYLSDNHIIAYLAERGTTLEAARDYAMLGCSQPVAEPQRHYMKPVYMNQSLILDLALHNGVSPVTGKRIGPETGDPRTFGTFEEVLEAFKEQCEFATRRLLWAGGLAHRAESQLWRMPLLSALLPNCLDNGQDLYVGGNGAYPVWYAKDRGFVNAADSLAAIKKLVYDTGKLTMAELLEALDANFEGERGEEIRQMCLAAPKYGNDVDEVDYLLRDIAKFSASIIFSEKNAFGFPYAINRPGVGWHYVGGKGVGALPDGRKAKEILADGSLSPSQGLDRSGPTAVLKSALKADFNEAAVAILNMKMPITIVQSDEALNKVAGLTETFLGNGGIHIQYNFLNRDTLLEAKRQPERFKDLVVRVAGYSAYFVNLSPEVQDEIIRRTEQCL
ncbi:MAG: hypothetical protein HYX92_20670 [Chloroflexi bacterium]|nr:hypothetical protein [Chloroflexota bacterium]